MEVRSGDPRLPALANQIAMTIEAACERLGLDVDEALCIVVAVAADYGRSEYGNDFLPKLAEVVATRADMPMPERVN